MKLFQHGDAPDPPTEAAARINGVRVGEKALRRSTNRRGSIGAPTEQPS